MKILRVYMVPGDEKTPKRPSTMLIPYETIDGKVLNFFSDPNISLLISMFTTYFHLNYIYAEVNFE
jgi:hypothetical protein